MIEQTLIMPVLPA